MSVTFVDCEGSNDAGQPAHIPTNPQDSTHIFGGNQEATTPLPANNLSHGSHGCPGFTDHTARQLVEPWTFRRLLSEHANSQIIIPLFQRKYCWERDQGVKWLEDLRKPVKKNGWNECHSTGKAIFKIVCNADGRNEVVCIDGQQRITTTILLLLTVRAKLLRCGGASYDSEQLIQAIDDLILLPARTEEGFPITRLVPSMADRHSFLTIFEAAGLSNVQSQCVHYSLTNDSVASALLPANQELLEMSDLFAKALDDSLCNVDVAETRISYLKTIVTQAVDEMYIVAIFILNEVDLSQVFLWLQEKALLGMGAILQNLAPGIMFHACDLIRNTLMAPYMKLYGLGSAKLEAFYYQEWLLAIELKAKSLDELDGVLERVASNYYEERDKRAVDTHASSNHRPPMTAVTIPWHKKRTRVSSFEHQVTTVLALFKKARVVQYDTAGIELYARFHTFVEDFTAELQSSESGTDNEVSLRVSRCLLNLIASSAV